MIGLGVSVATLVLSLKKKGKKMELIDLINELKDFRNKGFLDCNIEAILLKLKKIENGKKVKIPQVVADYIEYAKEHDWDLQDSMNWVTDEENRELHIWFFKGDNIEIFARAWLDGYEIKPEKRYTVKVKANGEYLNWGVMNTFYFSKKDKTYFVKSRLENAGFGWVFDCPDIEIEEVSNE